MQYRDIQDKISTAIQRAEADGYMETAIVLMYLKADLAAARQNAAATHEDATAPAHDNIVTLNPAPAARRRFY